jgi:hypothetical protein
MALVRGRQLVWGIAIATLLGTRPKEVTLLYWLMVIVMAGVGFGWVNVRRRRKAADGKAA